MFYGSDTHAEAAAAIFSIIASCRLHGLDPRAKGAPQSVPSCANGRSGRNALKRGAPRSRTDRGFDRDP
jgi:hypothetical protein